MAAGDHALDKMEVVGPGGGPAAEDEDILSALNLTNVLQRLRARKLRSTFTNSVADLTTEDAPIRARCVGGSLLEIVNQPVNEDQRRYDQFDARLLRTALIFKETGEESEPALEQPGWMSEEMPWGAGDDGDKKRRRKGKKKKKKRRRNGEGGEGAEGDEKRKKKKTAR